MNPCPECRHIMPSGDHCHAAAMRGTSFCYFHGRTQRPARARRPAENPIQVQLVFEPASAQQAYNEIVQALAANRITNRRAAILIQGVQMANAQSANLPSPLYFEDNQAPDDLSGQPAEQEPAHGH